MCVYNHGDTYLFRFNFFTPLCKFPFIRRISEETKLLPSISQMLAFLGSLFIIILAIKIFLSFASDFHFNL